MQLLLQEAARNCSAKDVHSFRRLCFPFPKKGNGENVRWHLCEQISLPSLSFSSSNLLIKCIHLKNPTSLRNYGSFY